MYFQGFNPGYLKIQGKDAKKFLQGQLTCDVELANADTIRLGAHCNPQGRIISLFYLFLIQDNYFLFMPENMLSLALSALKKYAVFFKVEMTAVADKEDLQLKNMAEIFRKKFNDDWEHQHVQQNIPIIYPETSGKFLPHELNLHQLEAVSFNKGCYTGQEIIARIHYKGKIKSRLCKAVIKGDELVQPGLDIYYKQNNEKKICGTLVHACRHENNCQGLIVLNELPENIFLFVNEREIYV